MTAYDTEFIKSAPAYAVQGDLFVLENTIDFSDDNLDNGDTARLFEFDGVHVLKVMWRVTPCNAAAEFELGDSGDPDGWSNAGVITAPTGSADDEVGQSQTDTADGKGVSYEDGAEEYLEMTVGAHDLTSGSITVKALCVRV